MYIYISELIKTEKLLSWSKNSKTFAELRKVHNIHKCQGYESNPRTLTPFPYDPVSTLLSYHGL